MKLEKKSIKLEKNVFFKKSGVKPNMKKTVVQHAYYCTVSEMKEYQKFIIRDKSVEFFFHIQKLCML